MIPVTATAGKAMDETCNTTPKGLSIFGLIYRISWNLLETFASDVLYAPKNPEGDQHEKHGAHFVCTGRGNRLAARASGADQACRASPAREG
jgi:hypothetical protein